MFSESFNPEDYIKTNAKPLLNKDVVPTTFPIFSTYVQPTPQRNRKTHTSYEKTLQLKKKKNGKTPVN